VRAKRRYHISVTGYGGGSQSYDACKSQSNNAQYSSDFLHKKQEEAKGIVAAWRACVTQPGMHVSVYYGEDPKNFFVYLRHVSDSDSAVKVKSIVEAAPDSPAFQCKPSLHVLSAGIRCTGSRTIPCKRQKPDEEIALSVNSTPVGGAAAIFVNAIRKDNGPPAPITISALDYIDAESSGIARTNALGNPIHDWGDGIANDWRVPRPDQKRSAVYRISAKRSGTYKMSVVYASRDSRPVTIRVNDLPPFFGKLGTPTGGFCMNTTPLLCKWGDNLRSELVGVVHLSSLNTLIIDQQSLFPHIKEIKFEFVE
jgi:hypothetical protein